ncbi:MAG: hypothetical protein JEZ06_14505 [Anaerolineaceae bacterium]|nr:hypothetical protein [Anaerolineaceae bacterium]
MSLFDRIILLLTGLTALYLVWRFYSRYSKTKQIYDLEYMTAFVVLFVSGVLLIFGGYGLLASPYVLTIATLIPLCISMGLVNQLYPQYKKIYGWFALIGLIAIAITSISGMPAKKIAVPVFHGVAGLIIFLAPILNNGKNGIASGFWFVGLGGLLIGLGGIALAFISAGAQLLFFSPDFVMMILAPLLLLMTLAFTYGFVKDIYNN